MNEATHKKHMLEILTDIYQNPFLAHNLYFKGGTALFLFHDLPRFSTDLDFDIRAGCGDRNRVFEELKQIVSRYGNLREATKKRYTFFFLLSLIENSFVGRSQRVRVNFIETGAHLSVTGNCRHAVNRFEIGFFGCSTALEVKQGGGFEGKHSVG